ncbi:MAG: hypothetical protein ACYC6C_05230 [Coriobacteriia bacterium]
MTRLSGAVLLQAVAQRILVGYLNRIGHADARPVSNPSRGQMGVGVDLTYTGGGRTVKVKVKPDSYFGTDPAKVGDRSLVFYRPDAGHYAFESISNSMTREPGWMFNSDAGELYYYYVALAQTEDEIAVLYGEPDDIFFSELKVERDELRILPMRATQDWFNSHFEEYAPRPANVWERSAWYRLIPRSDLEGAVTGIRVISPIYSAVAR